MDSAQPISKDSKSIPQILENLLVILMAVILLGVTIYFLASSISQLASIQSSILQKDEFTLPAPIVLNENDSASDKLALAELQYLTTLEARVQENRYRQAELSLMTRIWTSYLGFVTGMIMALVGASFILGKLKIDESITDLQLSHLKANLRSTSPGLVMAGLGVILIITTILTNHAIEVRDPAVYFTPLNTLADDALDVLQRPAPDIQE